MEIRTQRRQQELPTSPKRRRNFATTSPKTPNQNADNPPRLGALRAPTPAALRQNLTTTKHRPSWKSGPTSPQRCGKRPQGAIPVCAFRKLHHSKSRTCSVAVSHNAPLRSALAGLLLRLQSEIVGGSRLLKPAEPEAVSYGSYGARSGHLRRGHCPKKVSGRRGRGR